jgi:hypothetical protein
MGAEGKQYQAFAAMHNSMFSHCVVATMQLAFLMATRLACFLQIPRRWGKAPMTPATLRPIRAARAFSLGAGLLA